MKKILAMFLLFPSLAFAGDEAFDCAKKSNGEIECKAKRDNVAVDSIKINGGSCESPVHEKIHHKVMMKGDKFYVPGAKDCHYVSGMSIKTHDGKTQHFHAM